MAVTARTNSLETKFEAGQEELKQLNASELEITRLEREIELARANYRKYAENLEQARIDQELEEAKITSLNLMQAPSFSVTPVSPGRARRWGWDWRRRCSAASARRSWLSGGGGRRQFARHRLFRPSLVPAAAKSLRPIHVRSLRL